MKTKHIALIAASAFLATACTTTEKVAVTQIGDNKLDCAGLQVEFDKLDSVMAQAQKNKGVNGANVAAAVFFWPAVVGNYVNAADAEKLVDERQRHLASLAEEKGC